MNKTLNTTLTILGGVGAGAAAMYFLDPDRGNRRRALVRDKAVGLSNDARRAIVGKAKDLGNRATGLAHEAKGFLSMGNGSAEIAGNGKKKKAEQAEG